MKGTPPPPKEKVLSPSTISVPMDEDPTVTLKDKEKDKDDPTITLSSMTPKRPRERQRSITLVGHEKTPPDVTKAFSTQQTIRQSSAAPSPTSSNTDSRGRNDLSFRQLALLKEMLETPDPTAFDRHHSNGIRFASQPESQPRAAANGYGHPSVSAITLPSIPSSPRPLPAVGSSSSVSEVSSNMHSVQGHANSNKTNGSGKGTAGKGKRLQRFKDMLRSLTNTSSNNRERSHLSSASELDVSKRLQQSQANGRDTDEKKQRRRKSTDPAIVAASHTENLVPPPASLKNANSPYGIASLGDRGHRSSPRRPSLASIFRIGQSQASAGSTPITPLGSNLQRMRLRRKPSTPGKDSRISITEDADDDYSDWDRMDSASDLEGGMSPTPRRAQSPRHHEQATIKGRRARTPSVDQQPPPPVPPLRFDQPATQTPTPVPRSNSSQISLRSSPSKPRLGGRFRSRTTDGPVPPPPSIGLTRPSVSSSGVKTPASNSAVPSPSPADFKLALTPENIRPLLEYAKEVSARLNDCISELRDVQARSGPIAIEAGA
jgi:serine/arginine repetitive matrix protein 2